LKKYATVHAMDRRGHGNSGNNKEYAFELEVENVVAVVEKTGVVKFLKNDERRILYE